MKLYKETGHQPVGLLPAAAAADADLPGAVPHAQRGRRRPAASAFLTQAQVHSLANAARSSAPRSPTRSPTADTLHVQVARRSPGAAHDGDDVHHAAAADAQEHAGDGADRPVRAAAEAAALRVAGRVRGRWHRVPDRRAALLDDLEPVDDGSAVLRDPQQPAPGTPSRRWPRRLATTARPRTTGASPVVATEPSIVDAPQPRNQPKKVPRSKRRPTRPAVRRVATARTDRNRAIRVTRKPTPVAGRVRAISASKRVPCPRSQDQPPPLSTGPARGLSHRRRRTGDSGESRPVDEDPAEDGRAAESPS